LRPASIGCLTLVMSVTRSAASSPWAVFAAVVALVLLYLVGAEEGATSLVSGSFVHEFVHDGRHLLGFPCH
jgi:hypothetical protein